MIIHHQHAPGYKPRTEPDRYPSRASWPAPGAVGHHVKGDKKERLTLVLIQHQYHAIFRLGQYGTVHFNLQDFIVCD